MHLAMMVVGSSWCCPGTSRSARVYSAANLYLSLNLDQHEIQTLHRSQNYNFTSYIRYMYIVQSRQRNPGICMISREENQIFLTQYKLLNKTGVNKICQDPAVLYILTIFTLRFFSNSLINSNLIKNHILFVQLLSLERELWNSELLSFHSVQITVFLLHTYSQNILLCSHFTQLST